MPVIRKIFKVGGSLMIGLPLEVRQHLGANRGDYLVWHVNIDGRVVVEKLTHQKHPGFFIPGTGWLKSGR